MQAGVGNRVEFAGGVEKRDLLSCDLDGFSAPHRNFVAASHFYEASHQRDTSGWYRRILLSPRARVQADAAAQRPPAPSFVRRVHYGSTKAHRHVMYCALILTYSRLKSEVTTFAPALPSLRSNRTVNSRRPIAAAAAASAWVRIIPRSATLTPPIASPRRSGSSATP